MPLYHVRHASRKPRLREAGLGETYALGKSEKKEKETHTHESGLCEVAACTRLLGIGETPRTSISPIR